NSNPLRLEQVISEATFNATQWNQGYFFQDDIKVTRNFTVNAGLRYEYSTVPLGFFGATDPAVLALGVPGPMRPDKNNWAPRVGFAYSPDSDNPFLRKIFGHSQSSIRGGFGMAYDVLFYNILITTANNYPRVIASQTDTPVNLFP